MKHLYRSEDDNGDYPLVWCRGLGFAYDPDHEYGSFVPAESNCPACFAAVRAFALECEAAEDNAAAAAPPAFVGTVEELATFLEAK